MAESNLENEIEDVHMALSSAKHASKHLQYIHDHLDKLREELERCRNLMHKEHKDVVELEKRSIKNLFQDILGSKEEQLDIEKQEYLQALLKYRSIVDEIELAEYEHGILHKKHLSIPKLEQKLHSLIQIKEQKLRFHTPGVAKKVKEFNLLIDLHKARMKEIKEALEIAHTLLEALSDILAELHKVKQFGSKGLMHGKQRYSSYLKKSYIDSSQKKAIRINALLQKYHQELHDIFKDIDQELHIEEFEHFIDHFYDFLITDWVIQNKLKSAINGTTNVENKVKRMYAIVEAELHKQEKVLHQVQEQKRDYILHYEKDEKS